MSQRIDRRAFLKALGLSGGAGAVALYGLPERRLSELGGIIQEANANRPSEIMARPFWVKRVPEITLGMGEMRDDYQRWDPVNDQFHSFAKYVGKGEADRLSALSDENTARWLRDDRPGYALRDRALANAVNLVNMSNGPYGGDNVGLQSWTPMPWTEGLRQQASGLGVAYSAPREIAARDIKAAARHFGSALTGITSLDRRLIFEKHSSGKAIVFEDVAQPYSNDEKFVIPESFGHVIVLTSRMSPEIIARAPSALESAGANFGYSMMTWTSGMLAEFIRGLGYEAIPLKNNFSMNVAFAARAGLGEVGRINRLVTPEYGPMVRLSVVLTNLPLAVDGPIDAGIAEFCARCKKCAQDCPSGALSFDDQPSFQTVGAWNNPGHKAWFPDSPKCFSYWQESTNDCGICFASCPWSKKDAAWMHELVKSTAAATPLFDRFMRTMDDGFGYGVKNTDAEQLGWWELDMPEYGFDTSQGHRRV